MRRLLILLLGSIMCLAAACGAAADELTPGGFYNKIDNNIFTEAFESAGPADFDFGLGLYTDKVCYIPYEDTVSGGDVSVTGASACINVTDNTFLKAENIYERIFPASVTKLMTALLAIENCDLSEMITVTDNGVANMLKGAKLCGFEAGDTMSMGTLLTSMLVYSGNDAAYIIAVHISGSEDKFAELMNERAQGLLAVDTHFVNSHGLHNPGHYTTAYDMYLIFNECLKHSELREMMALKHYTAEYADALNEVSSMTFDQTNLYFTGEFKAPEGITVHGGKTGTTPAAGNCMILSFTGSDGKDYICEVFKAPTREDLYGSLDSLMKLPG